MATISLDFSATLTWPSTRRWRAAKAEAQLLAAKQGEVGDGLRTGQDGDQAEQQDLLQRVVHFPLLAGIFQIIEMTQEDDGFVERDPVPLQLPPWLAPSCESRVVRGSALPQAVHLLLHPIAL
jgi:hypothetical protein